MNWALRDGMQSWLSLEPSLEGRSSDWRAGWELERRMSLVLLPLSEVEEALLKGDPQGSAEYQQGSRQFRAERDGQIYKMGRERILWVQGALSTAGRDQVHLGVWAQVVEEANRKSIPFLLESRWLGLSSRDRSFLRMGAYRFEMVSPGEVPT